MPKSAVLSIFTRSRRGLLSAMCAGIALLYLALAIGLACVWPASATVSSSGTAGTVSFIDRTALNCVFGIVCSFWGVMAYLRCLDPRISRRLAAIAVILTLWLMVVTIKWNTSNLDLARYLWYGYYIPMACLPPLCLSCALRSAGVEIGETAAWIRTACAALGIVFAVLALTNDVHRLFFTFDVPNPGFTGMYSYGPAYWVFFVYNALCYLAFFCVLWRSSRSALRGLVAPSATVATAGLLFCAAYALRMEWAVSLNFSLVYGILVMVTLELCLDLGLIPSTRSFKKVFDELPFDLKILSRSGSLYRQTKVAGPLNASAVNRVSHGMSGSFRLPDCPDSLFVAWPLSGGMALLTQDMSGINELNRTLGKRSIELEHDLEALEHDRELAERLAELEAKSRLMDDIDVALSASMTEVTTLLNDLPAEPRARQRQLERAACSSPIANAKVLLFWRKRPIRNLTVTASVSSPTNWLVICVQSVSIAPPLSISTIPLRPSRRARSMTASTTWRSWRSNARPRLSSTILASAMTGWSNCGRTCNPTMRRISVRCPARKPCGSAWTNAMSSTR